MAEVLSQSQIDALLNSMQSGGAEEKKEEKPKQQFFIDKGLEEQMCKCYYTKKY